MIIRAIDGSNDWTFGAGWNNYVKNVAAVGQLVKTNLQSFRGDCFFSDEDGLPWWDLLGGKSRLAVEMAVSATILNTPGVRSLTELRVNLDANRSLNIEYKIITVYSTTIDLLGTVTIGGGKNA